MKLYSIKRGDGLLLSSSINLMKVMHPEAAKVNEKVYFWVKNCPICCYYVVLVQKEKLCGDYIKNKFFHLSYTIY